MLGTLGVPPWTININNRKVLQGFYEGLGIGDPLAVIRIADKMDKVGPDGVANLLGAQAGLDADQVRACLDLAAIRATGPGVVDEVRRLGVKSDLLTEGLDELAQVLEDLGDLPPGSVVADLSIARGLDYYTGTVYEAKFVDWPDFGSICSGGRYENLAGSFIRRNLPGVGISIGLTRIFAKLLAEGLLPSGPASPADVLVVIPAAQRRAAALATATALRARGLKVETYHQPDKLAKQVRYAARKGIGFVWFPPFDEGREHEVKNMATGDQAAADPAAWTPTST